MSTDIPFTPTAEKRPSTAELAPPRFQPSCPICAGAMLKETRWRLSWALGWIGNCLVLAAMVSGAIAVLVLVRSLVSTTQLLTAVEPEEIMAGGLVFTVWLLTTIPLVMLWLSLLVSGLLLSLRKNVLYCLICGYQIDRH